MEDLPGGEIPEWVYSWHTRKGRQLGQDCVNSIIQDQQALEPLQLGLFDGGDWQPHIDKALDKFNPKGRSHEVGINWDEIMEPPKKRHVLQRFDGIDEIKWKKE